MALFPLGFIIPADRTREQHVAHEKAVAHMVRFNLPQRVFKKGEGIDLTRLWTHPDVVADVGFAFQRIHQITGSCVWAGGTNAVMSTIASQRIADENPTKAFMPFTLHNYAYSRHYMGDDGKGEGSMGSTFAKSLKSEGVRDWPKDTKDNMPEFTDRDGFSVTQQDEMNFSSIRNGALNSIVSVSKEHLFGNAAECKTVEDIRAMVTNGYGVTFACNNFIGNGKVRGTGNLARVMGKWDGRGGHQQSIHGFEEHPDFGPIYLALNNWPKETYPTSPHQAICSTWVLEKDVEEAMRLDAEVFGLSNLDWFPARPKLIDWMI